MQRTQTTCLIILTTIATGLSLYFLRSVLLPFVIAFFVVIGCRPILEVLRKRLKLNRIVAFALTFMTGFALLAMLGFLVWASINNLSQHPQAYQQRLNVIVNWAATTFVETNHESDPAADPDGGNLGPREQRVQDTAQAFKDLASSVSTHMQSLLLNLAGSLSSLWLFGVPLAILFGMLAFVLNYIPNLGPLVATALPVPFLVLNSELDPIAAIACFVLISAIQFTSGNVIETRLMGKSFDVSPTVLLLSLMFFGLIWGIVGMFLATPMISIVKIVLNQSQSGRPIAELMAGRWMASGSDNVQTVARNP